MDKHRTTVILENLTDGFILLDRDWRCTYINGAGERILRRSRLEMIGKHCDGIFPESRGSLMERELNRAIVEQAAVEFEYYHEPWGAWFSIRACPAPEGELFVYIRDVTAEKCTAVELQRSQSDLMDFLENAAEGLHWVGPDGTVLWANQAELNLLGYSREEYIGHSIIEFHTDRKAIDDLLRRLTSAEEIQNYEATLRCKDGSVRHVLINSNVLWFEGQFIHTRCFTRDITGRKRAEEELRASEQRFSRFMENLPGLAWMKDLEGRYSYVNAAAAKAFRMAPAALYGKTDIDLFPPETAAQFRENDRKALASAEGILTVESLEHDDGILHHSIVSKFPVFDLDGRITAVGGMAIDITDRVRAEEALLAADRRKDEFLAMLAHELRNPLAPILTAVEIQRMLGAQDPILNKQREVISRQVKQMKRLLDDLLDVSRITQGKIQLVRERVSLSTVLTHAVETSRPLIEERGHTLQVTLPEHWIEVEADVVRLSQIFTNLLNNAARYTEPGGKIWLTAAPEGKFARITVKDTGVGMTPEVLARAFELFAQGSRGLDRSQGGLGIGLTLARQLAVMHGGTISARSGGPGQGSEFTVTLPLWTGQDGTRSPEVSVEPPGRTLPKMTTGSNGCAVLIVEDNTDHAEGLALILGMEGYDVCVAHNGASALELAKTHRPLIGILDIGLPGMDGFELARRLRVEPGLPRMILIAVTGHARQDDLATARESGFDYHFAKPLEVRELLSLVSKIRQDTQNHTGDLTSPADPMM